MLILQKPLNILYAIFHLGAEAAVTITGASYDPAISRLLEN